MQPVPPFWFQQRQAKMEPAGTNTFRLTAPNQGEAFIFIERADNDHWSAVLKTAATVPSSLPLVRSGKAKKMPGRPPSNSIEMKLWSKGPSNFTVSPETHPGSIRLTAQWIGASRA